MWIYIYIPDLVDEGKGGFFFFLVITFRAVLWCCAVCVFGGGVDVYSEVITERAGFEMGVPGLHKPNFALTG